MGACPHRLHAGSRLSTNPHRGTSRQLPLPTNQQNSRPLRINRSRLLLLAGFSSVLRSCFLSPKCICATFQSCGIGCDRRADRRSPCPNPGAPAASARRQRSACLHRSALGLPVAVGDLQSAMGASQGPARTLAFPAGARASFQRNVVEAAWTAVRQPGPLHTFYERTRGRRGHDKAVVATARKLAILFWCMLTRSEDYAHQQPAPTNNAN